MRHSICHRSNLALSLIAGIVPGLLILLIPSLLRAQGLGQAALSTLPADTHQLTYTDLRQIRSLPDYPQIRAQLLGARLRGLADSLRLAGDDPEKDADEVVLGWRGDVAAPAEFFGLAAGDFRPDPIRDLVKRGEVRTTDYAGLHLYSADSGEGREALYFTFLSGSSAAFGRLSDLKALLDARAGLRPALATNPEVVNWEAELDGSGPQWGLSVGRAAANQAALWLTGGVKAPAGLGALMAPVRAVLYTIDIGTNLSTHISVVCDRPETASAMTQIIGIWRNSQPVTSSSSTDLAAFLASLNISADGDRVVLDGSGPVKLVQQLSH